VLFNQSCAPEGQIALPRAAPRGEDPGPRPTVVMMSCASAMSGVLSQAQAPVPGGCRVHGCVPVPGAAPRAGAGTLRPPAPRRTETTPAPHREPSMPATSTHSPKHVTSPPDPTRPTHSPAAHHHTPSTHPLTRSFVVCRRHSCTCRRSRRWSSTPCTGKTPGPWQTDAPHQSSNRHSPWSVPSADK
jgi:hypothetical protein